MNRTPTTVPRHPDTPQPPSTTIRVLRTTRILLVSALRPVAEFVSWLAIVLFFVTLAFGALFLVGSVVVYACGGIWSPDTLAEQPAMFRLAVGFAVTIGPLYACIFFQDSIVDAWRRSAE